MSKPAEFRRLTGASPVASDARVDDARSEAQSAAAKILLNDLFECDEECLTCLAACFCAPCVTGMTAERLGLGKCALWAACYWLSPVCVGAHVRSEIYHLAGDHSPRFAEHVCVHLWCGPCALTQEARAAWQLECDVRIASRRRPAAQMTRL